jgi:hypothetical protein
MGVEGAVMGWGMVSSGELGTEASDLKLTESMSASEAEPFFFFFLSVLFPLPPPNALLNELRSCGRKRRMLK